MIRSWRFALVLAALAAVLLPGGPVAALQAIPDGIDVVVSINNHSALPLLDLVGNNPMIPPKGREMFDNFVKAVSFNPLTDITSIQVMAKIADKAVVVVGSGKYDGEKLLAQLKLVGEKKMEAAKINDLNGVISKDGKGAICFPDASTVVAGTPDLVKAFLTAHAAKKSSDAYAPLLAKASDKAYICVLAAGEGLGKALMTAIEKKAMRKNLPPAKEALRNWAQTYFLAGIIGKSLVAQQLDDRFEMWATYDHADAKDCVYHVLSENTDPRFRIDNAFKELLKTIATLPAPPAPTEASEAFKKAPAKDEDKAKDADKEKGKDEGKDKDKDQDEDEDE